jgi:hypothetical protein
MNALGAIYVQFYSRDTNQADLLRRGIELWHLSLENNPHQPHIVALVKKWGEKEL